ncbi:GNAT family N-acetyltransferase [Rubripirellula tenax]|nr:GNAT family N-acetyltransferase [Rubripirellula tenax]
MHVDIRDASTHDAAAISLLVSSLAREHIGPSLGPGGLDVLIASLDFDSTLQRLKDDWLHLAAFDDRDLVAVVVVKPPIHLYHLFVRSDLQRSGIGTKLLDEADRRVQRSCGLRLATVNSSLNAVSAYMRFGFKPDGGVVDIDGVRFQPMSRHDCG